MQKLKVRTEFIDVYRGIGIFLMIACHVYFGYAFDKFVHAFHMPMFFFVSGFFFRFSDTKNFLKKKIKTLIIPYIIFGSFNIYIYSLLKGKFYYNAFEHLFWINTEGLMDVGAVWFLTSLFWASIIYLIINKLVMPRSMIHLIVVVLAILGNLSYQLSSIRLPWSLESAFVAVGFIHLGNIFYKKKDNTIINRIFKLSFFELLILTVITCYLIYINGYINMRTGQYANISLFWINALLSIIIVWNTSKFFVYTFNKKGRLGKFIYFIKIMGRDSITFLCLNQIVICTLNIILPVFNIYIRKICILVITIFLLFVLNHVLSNTKIKIILGK